MVRKNLGLCQHGKSQHDQNLKNQSHHHCMLSLKHREIIQLPVDRGFQSGYMDDNNPSFWAIHNYFHQKVEIQ